jgi:UDP-N-acetylglucosamine--N-acetylmuramyl-(pentapeptide) pyrophosphoryl-undecaprenol N-acetylglucosamine transferase
MDSELTAAALRGRVEALLEDDERRELLASRIRGLATPGAADEIATRLLRAAKKEDEG